MSTERPWIPLTLETAKGLQGATIEARRGGEVERHETGTIYRSMCTHWLRIGGCGPLTRWSDGLQIDERWEVRQLGPVMHRDARAFAGAL